MNDHIALVTGANKGIGFEIARQLAARGVRVLIGARDAAKARQAAETIGERAEPLTLDVDDPASIQAAARQVARHGRLDILVNNAGIYPDEVNSIAETKPDVFWSALRTNAVGPLLVIQAFLPLLEKSRGARVVNMSSGMGALSDMESAYGPAYSISKTTLNGVTRQFAAALKDKGIAVNSMCPGWVRTDMGGPNATRPVEQGADTAVWLALDAPPDITGRFIRDRQTIPW